MDDDPGDCCECIRCAINALFGPSLLTKIKYYPYPAIVVMGKRVFDWSGAQHIKQYPVENWE